MAAILPHLAELNEATELEKAYDACSGSSLGIGLGDDHPSCPASDTVLAEAHAGLLNMAFVREAVFEGLQTKQFVVQAGDKDGKRTKDVFLILDEAVGEGPPWNPAVAPNATQYQLLSWTSKMNAPSFSLPAGAPQNGGSCPGAVGGQSIVPASALTAARKHINAGLGKPTNEPVQLAKSIC